MDTKLDNTPLQHAAIAIGAQVLVGLLTGNWLAGALLGLGIFLGRENAQAEYRWMNANNVGRDGLPWWGAFDPRVWNKLDPWLDWLTPALAVSIISAVQGWLS